MTLTRSSQRFVKGRDRGIVIVAMDFGQARSPPIHRSCSVKSQSDKSAASRAFAGWHAFIARVRRESSVLGLPHSDTRDVTVSGPLVYWPHLTSKNGCLLTKTNFFLYKFSVFEISCIQVYSEVLSKVTPRKREREWQDSINWNEKCIYPTPTQNAGRGSCRCPGASTPLSPPPRR
jgi:hypothetical protein